MHGIAKVHSPNKTENKTKIEFFFQSKDWGKGIESPFFTLKRVPKFSFTKGEKEK